MAKKDRKTTRAPLPATTPQTTELDRLADDIAQKRMDYEAARSNYEARWERALTYMEMRAPARKYAWQSNAFLPVVSQSVQVIRPRIKKLVIGQIPLIKLIGKEAAAEEMLISYYLRKTNGYLELCDGLDEACLYGTAFWKILWNYSFQRVVRKVPKIKPGVDILARAERLRAGMPETDEFDEVSDIVETCNRPEIYHVPLTNIFCNANDTDDIQEAEIIEESYVTYEWLKARSRNKTLNPYGFADGQYDNIDKIEEHASRDFYDDAESASRSIREEVGIASMLQKYAIKLLTYQGDYSIDGEYRHNGLITVAKCELNQGANSKSHSLVLRHLPCPRPDGLKNYLSCRYERVPGRMYGRGIADGLLRMQEITNSFFRAQMDRDTLALHRPIGYNTAAVDDPSLISWRMGGRIPCNGPPNEMLKEFSMDPTHPGSWAVLDKLLQASAEISGAKNLSEVEKPGSNRTASGIGMVMGAAGERILDTARSMAEELIPQLGQSYHTLIRKHLNAPTEFTFVNNKGKSEVVALDPTKLGDEVDVYSPTIFERNDKQQEAQQMLQLIPNIASQVESENLLELLKTVWNYLEFPNGDKLFAPDQQSIPIEIVTKIIGAMAQQMGINPQQAVSIFGAMLNQMAASGGKMQGQGGGGPTPQGQRTPEKAQPAQNQGTARSAMPSQGPNTGVRR